MRWRGQHVVARDLSDKAHHLDVFHHNMREFNCMFRGKKKGAQEHDLSRDLCMPARTTSRPGRRSTKEWRRWPSYAREECFGEIRSEENISSTVPSGFALFFRTPHAQNSIALFFLVRSCKKESSVSTAPLKYNNE
jgi:hypothetical protein